MDKGAWQAPVHGVSKESDMTEQLTLHTSLHDIYIYTHTHICMYIYIFSDYFSIIGYYRILNIVPCVIQ